MAYCTSDDVKRLLRILDVSGNNQHKIKFSDSYVIPEAFDNNTGDGILKGITTIKTSYAGSEYWHIVFTSSTAFTLYRGEGTGSSDGSGVTSSTFTSTSAVIIINSTQWVGTPASGDEFKFRTDSNISEDDVDEFLTDADAVINGMLEEHISDSYVPFTGSVPTLIQKASMFISSNIIFTSVFSNLNTEQVPTLVRRWFNLGKNFTNLYLDSIAGRVQHKYARYSRFVSRASLFDKVGVAEADGVEGLAGEKETVDVPYDESQNTEEAL